MIGPCRLALLLVTSAMTHGPAADGPRAGQDATRPVPSTTPDAPSGVTLTLLGVEEVWAEAPHSAFTDLVRHGDALVLAFRVGRGHVSSDGALQVLRSTDGRAWRPTARLALEGYDLRDADLGVAPDGRLLLLGGAAPRPADGERAPTGTVAAWSEDGLTWSEPRIVVEPGRWLWRAAWSGPRAFGVSYSAGSGPERLDLLTSDDGEAWRTLVRDLRPEAPANETALAFEPSPDAGAPRLVALARGAGGQLAAVGVAAAPYEEVRWSPLGFQLGGPNLVRTPGGSWLAGGRLSADGEHRTAVLALDVETGASGPPLFLPSGGDTSYPGFAWWEGELLVSYYSSHEEGPTRIYVARVAVEEE